MWIFSSANALAVGQIFLKDSSGQVDQSKPYVGAQWDGQKWKLLKLNYVDGGQISVLTQLIGVWVFGNGDYWFAGGSVFHWDGTSPQTQLVFSRLTISDPNATVDKIWGISATNFFGIGNAGTIVHFDGSSWTKMTSNTTVDLQDIWGIDATHVWATGFNDSDGHSVVLQYDGTKWLTIYDNAGKSGSEFQSFATVWTNEASKIYLAGQSWIRSMNLNNRSFQALDTLSHWAAIRIRGLSQNDIFQVGYGSEAMHYNGVSWYHYSELASLNSGGAWFYCIYPTKDFVVIGGLYLTALNGFPVVVRGYR